MIKTQVQIPDHLYREAKRIAGEYELSFAEVVRRGLERVIPAFPRRGAGREWSLPVLDLRIKADPFADPDWREAVNIPTRERGRRGRTTRRRRS
jgi:hypothetical protein